MLSNSAVLQFARNSLYRYSPFNIKSFLGLTLSVFLFSFNTCSAQDTLVWDPNLEEGLAGYKVHYGTSTGNYDFHEDVGNEANYPLTGFVEGSTSYLAVTAYDFSGNESTYSNEVVYHVPDITLPNGSVNINSGAESTNSNSVTLNLSSTDNVGVVGYYVSEDSMIPQPSDNDWVSVTPTATYNADVSYPLSESDGVKTVYVWYMDAAGNVSDTFSDTITLSINQDVDGDGYNSDVDCNDGDASVNPGVSEVLYNGVDDDCNPATLDTVDADGDGYNSNVDCNDADASVNPGVSEVLYNGVDDDCNPATLDTVDADGDGYNSNVDCNDADASVNPGVSEILYNGVDDDCNPATLDTVDADGDGYNSNVDCNDADASVNPGVSEILYNGVDDDCNPATLDTVDADGDGYNSDVDCNDADASVNPGAVEVYDGIDNDCDGTVDEPQEDFTPPTMESVSTGDDPNKVTIVFSEPVEESTSTNVLNYSIDNAVTISTASVVADLMTVILTTSSHVDGTAYIVTVNNIKDLATIPNVITPNSSMGYTYTAPLVISNLIVESGQDYEIVENGLQSGSVAYINDMETYTTLPSWLEGTTYIKTANKDKQSKSNAFLVFDVNKDVTVYVARDDKNRNKPSWLEAFTDTGEDVVISDKIFSLFSHDYLAGTITLGGNENGRKMYTVIVEEQ